MLYRVALLLVTATGCETIFPLDPGCPDDYTQTATGCYRARGSPASFSVAEGDCELDGGHLAVLASSVEFASVFELALGSNERAWVGVFATDPPNYRWITDEVVDLPPNGTPWGPNEPTLGGGDNAAVISASDGTLVGLQSFNSDDSFDYVCEIDGFDPDPARLP